MVNRIKEFITAVALYHKSHLVLKKYHLRRFLVIPGILSVFYLFLLIFVGSVHFDSVAAAMTGWLPQFMQGSIMNFITMIFIWVLWLLLAFLTYKHVVIILLSPFLSYLSEQIEYHERGIEPPPFRLQQIVKDVVRSAVLNIRILVVSSILMVIAWLFVFIPVLGAVISSVLLVWIQSYYSGIGLVDFTLERKRLSVKKSFEYVQNHHWGMVGIGAGFMVILLIPILGWFTAPTYGAAAATLFAIETEEFAEDGSGESEIGPRASESV